MYVILSERLGTVGAKYDVDAARARGVNVDALIWGGFIGDPDPEASPTKKPRKGKVQPDADHKE